LRRADGGEVPYQVLGQAHDPSVACWK